MEKFITMLSRLSTAAPFSLAIALCGVLLCQRADAQGTPVSESEKAVESVVELPLPPDADGNADAEGNSSLEKSPDRYWVGLGLKTIGRELSEYLRISGGLMILDVIPDGPAAAAMLQEGDIIIRCNGDEVTDFLPFLKWIPAARGEALVLEVLRDREMITVPVVPQLRPERQRPTRDRSSRGSGDEDNQALLSANGDEVTLRSPVNESNSQVAAGGNGTEINSIENEEQLARNLRWMNVGPVVLLDETSSHARLAAETACEGLPDEYEISIIKKANSAAVVECKFDGGKFKATSDNINAIPERFQPHLARLFAQSAGTVGLSGSVPQSTQQDQVVQSDRQQLARSLSAEPTTAGAAGAAQIILPPLGSIPVSQLSQRLLAAGVTPEAIADIQASIERNAAVRDSALQSQRQLAQGPTPIGAVPIDAVPAQTVAETSTGVVGGEDRVPRSDSASGELAAIRSEIASLRSELQRLNEKLSDQAK